MSPKTSARPKPTRTKRPRAETGEGVLAGDEAWVEGEAHEGSANDDGPDEASANQDGADVEAERRAARKRRREQADAELERGGEGEDDEPSVDAAELDPQIERAEGEGMVTEYAKVSATDPGPEPLPEPVPEPEPDHGPGEPDDEPD